MAAALARPAANLQSAAAGARSTEDEEVQQDDDRDRNTDQPQQNTLHRASPWFVTAAKHSLSKPVPAASKPQGRRWETVTQPKPVPREAVLVVNTKSRKGEKLMREAAQKLEAAGVRLIASYGIKDPKDLIPTIHRAVGSGAAMVIVGGGDGSLSCSVDSFVGKDCVFALLPFGTANSFARTLGIPLDIDGAVNVIATGRRRRIDLGMIDGDYFANCAAMGLSPLIAETVPHGLKKVLGRVGYLGWAAYQMTRFRPFQLTITQGDRVETLRALEVRIANGPYHGGAELVEGASVDSGRIVVQAVVGETRFYLLWSWLATLLKLQARKTTTQEFTGKEMRVETDPPLSISIDGEVLAKTPVTARVATAVIEVVVPTDR
jgi:YegS/Rv2252/BmrU family lipid kinase